jgi:hypothetical protein
VHTPLYICLLCTKRPFGEEYQKSPALRNRGEQVTGCSPRLAVTTVWFCQLVEPAS